MGDYGSFQIGIGLRLGCQLCHYFTVVVDAFGQVEDQHELTPLFLDLKMLVDVSDTLK